MNWGGGGWKDDVTVVHVYKFLARHNNETQVILLLLSYYVESDMSIGRAVRHRLCLYSILQTTIIHTITLTLD